MEVKQENYVIKTKIIELEDKFIDLIVIFIKYEDTPIPFFEHKMNVILKESSKY